MNKWDYIRKIAARGDAYGHRGGACDLLEWCQKYNLMAVTDEESRRFWEDPCQPYQQPQQHPYPPCRTSFLNSAGDRNGSC